MFFNILELLDDIAALFHLAELRFVPHVERLRHVETVQPYLVGIDVLVPEASFLCSRHRIQLGSYMIQRQFVFLIPGLVIQEEEVAGGVDVVQVVLCDIIGADGSDRKSVV